MGFKYVKKMTQYSGNTGLRLDPQYTLVVKLVNQGVEIQKKKVLGVWGGEEGGTPVLHSGIFLQCVEFIENSLIPRYLTASGKKKTKSNISNQSRKIH